MSNLQSNGPRKGPPADLKRAARAVKSRHPLAKAKRMAGGGLAEPGARDTSTDKLASQNLDEKAPDPQPLPTVSSGSHHPAPGAVMTREDRWRADGDICAKVIDRPLNPRLVAILLPGGKRGRALVHPKDRDRFMPKRDIWVRPDGPSGEIFRVVGGYSRWGVRIQ